MKRAARSLLVLSLLLWMFGRIDAVYSAIDPATFAADFGRTDALFKPVTRYIRL